MHIRLNPGRKLFILLNTVSLALLAVLCILPVLHTIAASFSDPVVLTGKSGLILWPVGNPTLKGYEIVFKNRSIWTGYANTLFYVSAVTVVGTLFTCLAAFVFSRKYFLPRNFGMLLISFTMLFNAGIIPNYMLISKLKLINTPWAVILPQLLNAFNLVVLRTAFMQVPDSLEDSATLDGASDLGFLFRILMPLSKATIAVIVLFIAVAKWNSWFDAAIYLNRRHLYPLQLILREILIQGQASLTDTSADIASTYSLYNALIQYCTIVVSIIPILCVYPYLQKYFTKGVLIGAIKG